MKTIAIITVVTFVNLLSAPALAEEVVPLMKGEAAPFSGLLTPEDRMAELLEAEVERDKLKGELKVEKRYSEGLDLMYRDKLLDATEPPPFWDSPSFNWWLGFSIGVLATGLVIYGSVEVYKAIDIR